MNSDEVLDWMKRVVELLSIDNSGQHTPEINALNSLIENVSDLYNQYDLVCEEVKKYQLKDYAITQAEHMRAQVGDNTWHYAMEVWLYPETHYWDYDEEGTVQLIERYITTNRDAWVKHWGEPSEVARKRCEDERTKY